TLRFMQPTMATSWNQARLCSMAVSTSCLITKT
ncbi:ABC transporter family protein, partial [Vibrio parahaemolyticus V-223/04]